MISYSAQITFQWWISYILLHITPESVASNITPQIFWIKANLLLNLLETSRNLLIKIPEIINGIANPNEYAHKRVIPERKLVSVLAKTKIDPKIGPIQGVHPNPKQKPVINENHNPL